MAKPKKASPLADAALENCLPKSYGLNSVICVQRMLT